MIRLLLSIFLILFCFSGYIQGQKRVNPPGRIQSPRKENTAKKEASSKNNRSQNKGTYTITPLNKIGIRQENAKTGESLRRDIFFKKEMTNYMSQSEVDKITELAQYLYVHPNTKIYITGYATNEGRTQGEQIMLADKRAAAVANILINDYKISPERVEFKSVNANDPLPYSDIEQNRVAICMTSVIEKESSSLKENKNIVNDDQNKRYSIYEAFESEGNPVEELVKEANDLFTQKRFRESIRLLKKATILNDPEALLSLGLLYEKGLINGEDTIIQKSRKNDEEGFFYIHRSARQGFKPAQKELARLYKLGIGTPMSVEEYERWMKIYEKPYDSTIMEDGLYEAVELPAEFPGGQIALQRFLSANIRYPEAAQQNDIQGRVVVKFIVNKNGDIQDATVVRGVDKDLDREALRVVNKMPKWLPGMNNGVPVRSYFNMPITFKLQSQ